ncbi:cell division protein FtsL [Apilactobacillus bombintestini]|uniref:Cell division protein FtsL n=1 Tax=Apilactobacillus bombintestini TaxID=2419772 RepID=A0A387AUK0_9LACO|nr:cell division protein FtsL [Apilactobacillus bombintestini]AYF92426.1 cell division protein FtsL [Apilactobacillus bombintestini]
MAQNNLANRTYVNPSYQQKNNEEANYQGQTKVRMSLSKFEKTVLIVGSAIVVFLMVGLVGEKISLSNNAAGLQVTTDALNKAKDTNTTYKQEVSELQSGNRLQKIAKEASLSLNNKNVRNVSK